jgi:hypothetical protein
VKKKQKIQPKKTQNSIFKKDSLAVEELLSDLVLEVSDPDHKLAADATPTVRCPLQPLHADCAFMVLNK